ncbi:serine/threonine-protein kinase ULK3 [Plodia interpunctella]|uniref:serine/threonine-protein kinase ULK3 n=1 Tax=Plodia interpunctella TaxID=58824 RepID=UPI003101081B
MVFPKIEGYVVTERLGSGSYSTVYKAYTKVGARTTVAIKCIDKSRIKHSGSAVDNLVTEIRLLKTLTHPHIVHMKEFTWDDKNIYIIMEYCCGGDLSKYIQRYGRVPEKKVLYFLQQLASALKFLREKGVVHMDLKPHNLLLHKGSDGKYILKVADFGFAQHMSSEWSRSVRGSPLYMAPEMYSGEYDARVDLWSVGVIMYECLFGRAPYSSGTFKELVDKIQKQTPIEIPRSASIASGCRDLLTRLLQHAPARRISYEEFFSHPYLDLDHMPSRQNYDKAVGLIKQAIELDSLGKLSLAFEAYRDALLFLVPAVGTETDSLRRQALTAKLQSAEAGAHCQAAEVSVIYRDALLFLVPAVGTETDSLRRQALTAKLQRYMERAEEIKQYLKHGDSVPPAVPADVSTQQTVIKPCSTPPCESEERAAESDAEAEAEAAPEEPPPPARRAPRTSALRRLFSRQPVPYLTDDDSSITQDTSERKPTGEAHEGCRIT